MPVFERDVKTSRNNVYRLRILVEKIIPSDCQIWLCVRRQNRCQNLRNGKEHIQLTRGLKNTDFYKILVQICFYRQVCWTRENKLFQEFEKGEEWLEAYEEHLETGKPIVEILIPPKATDKEIEEGKRQEAMYELVMAKYDEMLGIRK